MNGDATTAASRINPPTAPAMIVPRLARRGGRLPVVVSTVAVIASSFSFVR
jgi:hypothetical protein